MKVVKRGNGITNSRVYNYKIKLSRSKLKKYRVMRLYGDVREMRDVFMFQLMRNDIVLEELALDMGGGTK